ncbi:MAG: GET complex subunit get1 [Tremellales sp. Tagirdzhanova-0007]|nr:MAG: GET complex subunit get1 [Tremellales sp. Tagirdzhanova-0007]
MTNLALLIFSFVFVTQLVSWIGKSVLQELAFSTYSRIFLASSSARQRALRKQVLEDKTELARTSSQDEFAKWAKLKRKLDKGLADLEKTNGTLTSSRTSFAFRFSTLLSLLTTGAQFVLVWWFRKSPVFWLPSEWLPGPVVWLLSFPSAPIGSVSSGAWCAVCKRVMVTGEEIVRELILPMPAGTIPVEPVAARADKSGGRGARIGPLEIEHDKLD